MNSTSRPSLTIYTCVGSQALAEQLTQLLECDRYQTRHYLEAESFIQGVESQKHDIDCLILEHTSDLSQTLTQLHQRAILLPAVILMPISQPAASQTHDCSYHTAEVWLQQSQINHVPEQTERAIDQFLHLTTACRLPDQSDPLAETYSDWEANLGVQQRRLADKLKERLGYLGVYYKRNPQEFFRNLTEADKQNLLDEMQSDYRDIILDYFRQETQVNQKIDAFVTKVFLADVSVSYILELHMELMDAFAKKLKLEGRNEDILLDYRLTLIDTVAHLGEMYRRSIPRDS